ncbi:unnamed protein product [Closterium sp. NIES-53]
MFERDRCREGGRHHTTADEVLTPAPKSAAAAAAAVADARGVAGVAAAAESGTKPPLQHLQLVDQHVPEEPERHRR